MRTMNNRRIVFCFFFCILAIAGPWLPGGQTQHTPTAERKVAIWRGEFRDASRSRTIPVKIYYPEDNDGKASPVILFSHGLGGSKEIYRYLGEYWAAHGYVSVHVQHPGSDTAVIWQGKLRAAVSDPANYVNRPKDISFAIDELTRISKDPSSPLHGRMDLDHLGVAGHSFGAYTVMAVAGQAIGPDGSLHYYGPDRRIRAGIAMSSDPALTANLDTAYDRITVPIFHMTGTKDQIGDGHNAEEGAIIGNATAAQRRVPYDHTRHAPAYLLTLKAGDHRVFSGRMRSAGAEHDEAYQKIVCAASTAFWDSTLKQNVAARRWLEGRGFASLLEGSGTFEQKHPSNAPVR
jgi:dienelactone hydrolase